MRFDSVNSLSKQAVFQNEEIKSKLMEELATITEKQLKEYITQTNDSVVGACCVLAQLCGKFIMQHHIVAETSYLKIKEVIRLKLFKEMILNFVNGIPVYVNLGKSEAMMMNVKENDFLWGICGMMMEIIKKCNCRSN